MITITTMLADRLAEILKQNVQYDCTEGEESLEQECLDELNQAIHARRVVINISDGKLRSVIAPEGMTIEVRDYDGGKNVAGEPESTQTDENGDTFARFITEY